MKTEYQIIAVDFDGTLCTDCFPKIGQPNTALIELLKGLRRQGRQIILWTCRCGNQLEEAVEWCRKWELEFDAVNENLPEIIERYGSDGRKIYADVYIDDKSCFPWEVNKDEKVGLCIYFYFQMGNDGGGAGYQSGLYFGSRNDCSLFKSQKKCDSFLPGET